MRRLILALALLAGTPAASQPTVQAQELPPSFKLTLMKPPPEPSAISLYQGVAPGSEASVVEEVWERAGNGQRTVRNVTRPTITPFLPDPAKATGAAVIVVPGGGFKSLAMDNEGWPIAQWFADRGVVAFVLKYRLNETPADSQKFASELMELFRGALSGTGPLPDLREPRATQDAIRAMIVVRRNARRWNIDPSRIGMIGFSAGAMTTLDATLSARSQERPAFIGYVYGPMVPVAVPSDAPPMFAAISLDDRLFGRQGFGVIENWLKAGRPVELHAYEKGGHGFGMGRPGTTSTLLMDQFLAWMKSSGWLDWKQPPDRDRSK